MTLESLLERPLSERRLGPFVLVEPLGRGGFAPVWLAKEIHGETELRAAAVKLFTLDAAPDVHAVETRRREILEEARALCSVEHPNVVRFYAPAVDEASGVMGLAMEYAAGAPLDRRLAERGCLSIVDALDVGAAIASALAAVHRAGLIHRDVKPANVIEAAGVYKLIDFGIAAADTPDRVSPVAGRRPKAGTATVSIPGLLKIPCGTIGYIDPVCLASGEPATSASDVYALGAMLFECITGKLPAAAWAEPARLREEVLDGRAPSPSLHDAAPDVPSALSNLVDAMLAPDRSRRPPSAEVVAKELTRLRSEIAGSPAVQARLSKKEVLWVDDDRFALESMSFWLIDRGYEVIPARTPAEALRVLYGDYRRIGCAIIDLCLPGASSPIEPSGLRLARTIKREWRGIPLICLSNVVSTPAVDWFSAHGAGYFHKHELDASMRLFMRTIEEAMTGRTPPPSTLVVHGKAERLLAEVKRYLTGELGWSDVRVLREIPSRRRSVAQKFSDEAREVDLVVVLLSLEDVTFASPDQRENQTGKADLVFELGYFLGNSRRRSCKVVVLTAAGASLPLMEDGVAVIDASDGLRSVEERIRLELGEWIE